MLKKKQFLERLNFLIDYQNREMEFDEAMRKFAPSDFTGFSDDTTLNFLLHTLEEDMNDEDGWIAWWLWDAPERGKNPEHCIIQDGEDTWQITTPEQLYGYLVANYGSVQPKELKKEK